MEKFFYKLKCTSTVTTPLSIISKQLNFNRVHGFDLVKISKFMFLKETTLFSLIEKFNGNCLIIKMPPMTFYKWHKDVGRQSSINMIIENVESHCMFGEHLDNSNMSITELKYEPSAYYLFNTQEEHSIANFSGTRYLLSIGFDDYSYDTLLEYCKTNDI